MIIKKANIEKANIEKANIEKANIGYQINWEQIQSISSIWRRFRHNSIYQ